MLRLNDEDQKALDWIMQSHFDRGLSDHTAWALAASEVGDGRLRSVGCLLDVLGACSTDEPPENLAGRTLGKIAAHRAMLGQLQPPPLPINEPLET